MAAWKITELLLAFFTYCELDCPATVGDYRRMGSYGVTELQTQAADMLFYDVLPLCRPEALEGAKGRGANKLVTLLEKLSSERRS